MKILNKTRLVYSRSTAILLAIFIILLYSANSVTAQTFIPNIFKRKPPIALEKDEPLSPKNVANYRLIVEEYARAACLPVTYPEQNNGPTSGEVNALRKALNDITTLQKQQGDTLRADLADAAKRKNDLGSEILRLKDELKLLERIQGLQGQIDARTTLQAELQDLRDGAQNALLAENKKRKTAAVKKRIADLKKLIASYDQLLSTTREDIQSLNDQKTTNEQRKKEINEELLQKEAGVKEIDLHITNLNKQLAYVKTPVGPTETRGCDPAEATRLRNNLIFIAISQADIVFMNYRAKRRGWSDVLTLFMNFLEIGFSSAVSITNGLRPKSVLADLTTLVQGTHKFIQKDLRLEENQAYFNAMEGKRLEVFNKILERMTQPDRDYSYPMALMDVVKYAKAGTLDDALAQMHTLTAAKKDSEEAKVVTSMNILVNKVPSPAELDMTNAAFRTLNDFEKVLAKPKEDASAAAARETALKNLTSIAKAITDDPDVVKGVDSQISLKDVFAALKETLNQKEPEVILEKLWDFREAGSKIASFTDTRRLIDKIIVEKGK